MPPQVVHVRDAGKVAAALANPKCQKILDYLSKHADATETKLSKELSIPLSTVHYNMKVLLDARLVIGNEYTYSAKGKEVTHYKRNKNPIVIIQEEEQLQILKTVVPAAFITAILGMTYTLLRPGTVTPTAAPMFAQDAAIESGAMMAKAAAPTTPVVPQNMLPYFFVGVATMLFVTFLLVMIYRWWGQRKR